MKLTREKTLRGAKVIDFYQELLFLRSMSLNDEDKLIIIKIIKKFEAVIGTVEKKKKGKNKNA
jgi:hypothetical protein